MNTTSKVCAKWLPIDELNDLSKYHFNKTEDIIYSSSNGGINVKFVMKFLAYTRKKKTGNFKTHGELRKYKDAILWGAKVQNELLPSSFYTQIERYLNSFKKEVAVARRDGIVEDKAADPITVPLYHLFLKWALEENNSLVWFWTVAQWSCIAR